jgi:hypothetical protein
MAIYCDVCGDRILSAGENFGAFVSPVGFVSRFDGSSTIDDTCSRCGPILVEYVRQATANAVAFARTQK